MTPGVWPTSTRAKQAEKLTRRRKRDRRKARRLCPPKARVERKEKQLPLVAEPEPDYPESDSLFSPSQSR